MLRLKAKIRKERGKRVKNLLKNGFLPAVLYGPKIKNLNLVVEEKEFENVFKKAGNNSLITLEVENEKVKDYRVLIHDFQKDPVNNRIIHLDFFQPSFKEKIEAKIPLFFKGESLAVKRGGTLVKLLSEIEVKATPEKLPPQIEVEIEKLKDFESLILVADLKFPEGVEPIRGKEEVVAKVLPPEEEVIIKEEKETSEEKKE